MGDATMAAISGTPRKEHSGSQRVYNRLITMSASYANPGGDTLDIPTALGINGRVTQVVFEKTLGYNLVYNAATGKILAYDGITEIVNAVNLSTVAQKAKIYVK